MNPGQFKQFVPHDISGKLTIGQRPSIKPSVVIDVSADVTIGDDCIISDDVKIYTHCHPMARDGRTIHEQTVTDGVQVSALTIEDDVYIGANALIMPQVSRIATGCVVAAGAVLTKNPPAPYTIMAGNPARAVKQREPVNVSDTAGVQRIEQDAQAVKERNPADVSATNPV